MVSLLIKGLIIGLSIAAPVGPISILCIHRTLHEGFKSGLVTGLGAATADGVYGCIAGFGLTFISQFLVTHQFWIRLMGGLFLFYLGVKTILSRPSQQVVSARSNRNLFRAYITTFFLTLTNPMTILSFIAIFAGLGIGSVHTSYQDAFVLIFGIAMGSFLWEFLLSASVATLLRHKMNQASLYKINFISGMIIGVFGILALCSLFTF